jgi:alpha-glucosidase (family GH31 glycosyl hydrolase)
LLTAAHGFANRSIPVDVIVIDWLHWKVHGDWHFDPEFWPDPSEMVRELKSLNMEVMVTVWPWSHNGSQSYDTMISKGWVTGLVNKSAPVPTVCPPHNLCPKDVTTLADGLHGTLVDVTNPEALDYVRASVARP